MSTGIIVQARMGSTRLPGKILKTVLGRPLLFYQLERLQRVKGVEGVVVATTELEQEQPLIELCEEMEIPYYRGSEHDLLQRYIEAAHAFSFDVIVRSTGDCPLIDPFIVERAVDLFSSSSVDYLSNTLVRTYPRGMDVEVFTLMALERGGQLCSDLALREHATPPLYISKEFKTLQFKDDQDHSDFRLTVDTEEDFRLIEHILKTLYPENPMFSLKEMIKVIQIHPEWVGINQHIQQKKL